MKISFYFFYSFCAKNILTVALLGFTATSFAALTVVKDNKNNTVPSAPYTASITLPNQQDINKAIQDQKQQFQQQTRQQEQDKINAAQNLFPIKSDLTYGVVKKHRVEANHLPEEPLFVIGDDKDSIKWVTENSQYLNKIKAIGIVTNVTSLDRLQAIKAATGLQILLPANVDGLAKMVKTKHYPFLLYQGTVLQ